MVIDYFEVHVNCLPVAAGEPEAAPDGVSAVAVSHFFFVLGQVSICYSCTLLLPRHHAFKTCLECL
jgi:hypothetical protein